MPPERWTADRPAFDAYWAAGLEQVAIDDTVRDYLRGLVDLVFLPRPFQLAFGSFNRFVTAGFLPPLFRDQMQYPWTAGQQRRFDRLLRIVGWLDTVTPQPVRAFPFNVLLRDMRLRQGRSLA